MTNSINTMSLSTTFYVDTQGNDANSGTNLDQPFKTIQKSMNTAVAGDTVYVRGGVYREQVDVFRGGGSAGKMLNVFAYENEKPMIRGSDQVTGWVAHSGNIWKKTNWTYNSQQVFVGGGDSQSLQQIGMPSLYTTFEYPTPVGNDVNSMIPGSFYYDAVNLTLYAWLADGADPNTKIIEASTRHRLFFMGVPYIHLKGFLFRHSNASAKAKAGAAVELGTNSIIEKSDIQYTDFAGLSMGYLKTGARAIQCNVSNNGNSGINAAGSYNFSVNNVKMNNNNTRKFNRLWHAGGLKATTKAYGTVEYSEIAFNHGSGIWFDFANSGNPITIRNNFIHDNGPVDSAIFFEVSKNGRIYNNIIANNLRRGIYLSGSDNTVVYNNTIVGTSGYAGIEVGGMPRAGATLTDNIIQNNIISHGTSKYDLFIAAPNGTTINNNLSDYNNFFRPSTAIQLSLGFTYNSIQSFSAATKMDLHSISIDAKFISLAQGSSDKSYAVANTSGVINAGFPNDIVSFDYVNVTRPTGEAFDIGAYENVFITDTDIDTVPPMINVLSPQPQSIITKGSMLTVSAQAIDNIKVELISIYIDGTLYGKSSTGSISYSWNSSNARIGTHHLYISAIDSSNNLAKKTISFVVK